MRLSALFAVLAAAALTAALAVPASAEPAPHATDPSQPAREAQSSPGNEPAGPAPANEAAQDTQADTSASTEAEAGSEDAAPDGDSVVIPLESDPADDESDSAKSDSDEATEPEATEPTVIVTIDKGIQQMTVWVDGVEQYTWPVSTGIGGYSTPSGEYTASSMNKIWYSKQWDNAPMPHAVFFTKKGHAIHGTAEEKKLGKPASHGCVRLSRKNAETLFKLVEEKGLESTQIVLTGVTPGGEYKVAQPPRQKTYPGYGRDRNGWFGQYGYYEQQPVQPRKRRRLFQPYYQAPPQPGYYQQRRGWFRPPGY
ncbi:MAG: L,D-transpeptidase family protein [Methyloceanibacter sp.]|uniref:L,D-transpeptidase n=1 Tax=Methyloceanibacter sp. TaxID=1965321 RepID=UPI003D6D1283